MSATSPKALVFDLDGVLVVSEHLHQETWKLAFDAVGISLTPEEEPILQGLTGDQVIAWLHKREATPAGSFDPEVLIQNKRDGFTRIMQEKLEPVPGVDAFLREMKGQLPLGLVTSARLRHVGQVMLLMNWRNIFDALIGADHVKNTKPNPEPYLHAAERLKLKPAQMLVFEDSAVGVESARKAGARVVGVTSTLPEKDLLDLGAVAAITDFNDRTTIDQAMAGDGKKKGWFGLFGG